MIRTTFGLLALLAVLPALAARDQPETSTPAEQYKALSQEYDKAMKAFLDARKEAKSPEAKQKVFDEKYPRPEKFVPRFMALAEKNPKDPVEADALIWIVTHANVPAGKNDPDNPRSKALTLLLRNHVRDERIAAACQVLGYDHSEKSQQLLREVLEKNPHRSAKAQACLGLARQAENQLRLARLLKNQPDQVKEQEEFLGKEAVAKLLKAAPDKLSKEAENLYERVAKDFGDVPAPRDRTLGKIAEKKLDALHHPILVGKSAPDIEGEDIDGQPFKLSDYRGKVVLLDFWGNW